MKKFQIVTVLGAVAFLTIIGNFRIQPSLQFGCGDSSLLTQNIEALSNSESDNRIRARCRGNCCICAKDDQSQMYIHGHAEFI